MVCHHTSWTLSDVQLCPAELFKYLIFKMLYFSWGKITHFLIDRFFTGFEYILILFDMFLTENYHFLTIFEQSSFFSEKQEVKKSRDESTKILKKAKFFQRIGYR
jgi:hypothetical protein